jgi:hypothetical protein
VASLPNVSLGGTVADDDVTAAQSPGVHVSDDAPKVQVSTGSDPNTETYPDETGETSDPGPATAGPDLPDPGPEPTRKPGPDPRPTPGTQVTKTTDLPDADLTGDRMTRSERGLVVVRHWAVQAAAGVRETTSAPGSAFTVRPPSFAEYRAYVASRAWVPEGYEKGCLIWVPLVYYNTVGNAGVLTGYAIAWLTGKLLHFAVAVAVVILTTALILIFN